jgi:hypothetical protein
MPDYVNQTDNTDQSADSTGCGMAFISWMMSQGYGLEKIAPTMVNLGDSGTLAEMYANLTGDAAANAWPNFQSAVNNLQNGISNDDPFNGLANPTQMTHLAPQTAELVGRVFASMVADLAAGRSPEQLAANVRAAMLPKSRPKAAVCAPKSKRLLPPGKSAKQARTA